MWVGQGETRSGNQLRHGNVFFPRCHMPKRTRWRPGGRPECNHSFAGSLQNPGERSSRSPFLVEDGWWGQFRPPGSPSCGTPTGPPVLPWLLPASVLAFAHYLQFLGQQPMKVSSAAESVSSCRASLMAFFSCVSSEMVNLKAVTVVFFLRHAFHSVKSVE